MKLAATLALKNIVRNLKFTAGVFVTYLVTSVMCVSFFIFSFGAQSMYDNMLDSRTSAECVTIAFVSSDTDKTTDLTQEQLEEIKHIANVEEVVKTGMAIGGNYIQTEGEPPLTADFYVTTAENGQMPARYIEEYRALGGVYDEAIVYGRQAGADGECVITLSLAEKLNAENPAALIGKTAEFTDMFNKEVIRGRVITGITDDLISEISILENAGSDIVFTDLNATPTDDYDMIMVAYLVYSQYRHLDGIYEQLLEMNIAGSTVSNANSSYSLTRLSQIAEFMSAVLALISAVCFAASVAFAEGAAAMRFNRSKTFYRAAFAVGMPRNKLTLSFLFEFFIVALTAFIISVPLGILTVNSISQMAALFTGIKFGQQLYIFPALLSLLPLAFAAAISAIAVRVKIRFER